jgi:fatty acid desaturase
VEKEAEPWPIAGRRHAKQSGLERRMMAAMLIQIAEIYAMIGVGVAAVFLLFGVDRIDQSARGSIFFRPLIAPGVVLLWPLVLVRWLQLERGTGGASK